MWPLYRAICKSESKNARIFVSEHFVENVRCWHCVRYVLRLMNVHTWNRLPTKSNRLHQNIQPLCYRYEAFYSCLYEQHMAFRMCCVYAPLQVTMWTLYCFLFEFSLHTLFIRWYTQTHSHSKSLKWITKQTHKLSTQCWIPPFWKSSHTSRVHHKYAWCSCCALSCTSLMRAYETDMYCMKQNRTNKKKHTQSTSCCCVGLEREKSKWTNASDWMIDFIQLYKGWGMRTHRSTNTCTHRTKNRKYQEKDTKQQ